MAKKANSNNARSGRAKAESQPGFDGGQFVELSEAVDIVLDLARQHVIDDPDMEEEAERQSTAIDTVEDFFVNNVFDGADDETPLKDV